MRCAITELHANLMNDADFALARNLMVDGQLRPNRVNDKRLLDAMRRLPRELFVPPAQAQLAYIDQDIPLGEGRVLLKPLVIARLLQLAAPRAGEAALVVGAGAGYAAAILASCGMHVVALEQAAALLQQASALAGDAIAVAEGVLSEGYPASAPYDLILVEGALVEIPEALARQVSAQGRLVGIERRPGSSGVAVIAEPSTGGRLSAQPAFDAAAPYLPGFAPAESFVF